MKPRRPSRSQEQFTAECRRRVLARDHGCVFCHHNYRPEDHIEIPDYDIHFHKGQAYGCCEYHAQFMRPPASLLEQGREMKLLLEMYLHDKEDPEEF